MSWISKLKDRKYYIDFDSGCVYENDTVVAEITSPTHINILLYFADHPEMWLKKDGIISNCWPDTADAEYVSDGTFYKQIHGVTHIHIKVGESIESRRGMGYKYHGLRKEEITDDPKRETAEECLHIPQGGKKASDEPSLAKNDDNVIKLASLLIHRNGREHPKIDEELELEIRYIIELLEQGLSDDFEEICEQAWEDLSLMQKALRIFKAYENLTDRSRNMSPDDTNTRLQ